MPKAVGYGNKRWPSGRNLGEFAKDVFRIENCKTDHDKALAFYEWTIRCMMRGPNYVVPDGLGTYSRSFDPLMMFASFGHFECTGWGWIAAEALQAAGLKARRVVGQNDGHTIYEVFYKGKDGKAGWHAFDAFQGWWFLNRGGEVASCAEVTADHNLVHDPAGASVPLGYHTDLAYLSKRHDWADALDIVQRVQGRTLSWSLKPGMEAASLFEPADPQWALYCGDEYPRGSHCQIAAYDHKGAPNFPQHEPYWKNYRRNMHDFSWFNSDKPVRTHGTGALRWQPLLYGAEAAEWSDNAVFKGNTVRPSGANKHCEVWYKLEVPYYVSALQVEGFVKASGSDYCGLCISADGGKTLAPLQENIRGSFRVRNGMTERKAGKPSVQFTQQLLLRFDLHSHSGQVTSEIEGLRITAAYQHNMFTQPFLLPGKNSLYLEGQALEGSKLKATWYYTLKGNEGSVQLESAKDGRVEKEVNLGFENIEDITMRGIALSCE
jgi:hypothetical protein